VAHPVLALGYARKQVRPAKARTRSVLLTFWAKRIAVWVDHCADAYARAALYEDLSRLSDAELSRRSLSRDTLARDLTQIQR
jgi:hypothetical protein